MIVDDKVPSYPCRNHLVLAFHRNARNAPETESATATYEPTVYASPVRIRKASRSETAAPPKNSPISTKRNRRGRGRLGAMPKPLSIHIGKALPAGNHLVLARSLRVIA